MKANAQRKKPKVEDWFDQERNYPHFDRPLPFEAAKKLVTDKVAVAKHEFSPFLSFAVQERRFRGRGKATTKQRPIKYASHRDACIYAYYSKQLSDRYEDRLKNLGLSDHVIAYRKGLGSNADLARPVFDEIERRGECVAIALDISGFFDNVDHVNLKAEWCATLGVQTLRNDHYNVFKSLTRWSEVDRDECYKRLGVTKKTAPRPLCRDFEEFRKRIKGRDGSAPSLVRANKDSAGAWKDYGIPQGSPASALLSNIYMLPFDLRMKELAACVGGYYRRYSDDIVWICDKNHVDLVLETVKDALQARGTKLFIKDSKTAISRFTCYPTNQLECDKPFQYLGFEFDGKKRLIRSQTLARYWRRALRKTRAMSHEAKKAALNGGSAQPYRRSINAKLTHLGAGNFVTGYAYRVQKTIGGSGEHIKGQMAGHRERLMDELVNPDRRRTRKRRQKSKS